MRKPIIKFCSKLSQHFTIIAILIPILAFSNGFFIPNSPPDEIVDHYQEKNPILVDDTKNENTYQIFETYERNSNLFQEKSSESSATLQYLDDKRLEDKSISINSNFIPNRSIVPRFTHVVNLPHHGPVTIDGNANFTTDGEWGGSGTENDPYTFANAFIDTTGGPGINISNTDAYFRIENVWVNGSINVNNGAFFLKNVTNGLLTNNTATSSWFGFYLYGSTNDTLNNNSAINNTGSGIFLFGGCNNNTLINNTATNNGNHGYFFYKSSYNTLINNYAINNIGNGFLLTSSSNNTLIGNSANNNTETGFNSFLANNNTLTNNFATSNGNHGFHLTTSSNNTLTNNNAISNTDNGFFLGNNVINNTLTNNFVTSNGNTGFYLEGASINILKNNTAFDNIYGFYLYSASANALINNTATSNTNTGYILEWSSNNNTLTNNIATNNTDNGFRLKSSSNNNTLDTNSATNNTNTGFYLFFVKNNTLINNYATSNINSGFILYFDSINNTLANNYATSNTGNGFYLKSSSINNTLINNSATSNANTGIYLESASTNILKNNTAFDNIYGFHLFSASANALINNTATSNTNTGYILESSSNNNTLIKNTANNNAIGLTLSSSNNNRLTENIALNNNQYGISLNLSSNTNTIERTQFINNNGSGIQALDNSSNNLFQFNYWNDWTNPDIDENLIVDLPYLIDGVAYNQDNHPLTIFFDDPIIILISPTNNTFQLPGTVIKVNINDPSALGQLEYNWDGGVNTTVALSNPNYIIITPLPTPSGQHILTVYAQDSLGSWEFRQFNFKTDGTSPIIVYDGLNNDTYQQTGSLVNLSVTDDFAGVAQVWYIWNNNETIYSLSYPYEITLISLEGHHTLAIYANDTADNIASLLLIFTIDRTSPSISSNGFNNNTYQQSGTVINLSVSDNLDENFQIWYIWDNNNTNYMLSDPYNISLIPLEGHHILTIYANDTAGNIAKLELFFIIDYTDPNISSNGLYNGTYQQTGSIINLSVADNLEDGFQVFYVWDNNTNINTLLDPYDIYLISPEGQHILSVFVIDAAGNSATLILILNTDDTAPDIVLNYPINGTVHQSGIFIDLTITGSDNNLLYHWDSGLNQSVDYLFDPILPAGEGSHKLFVYTRDMAGNWALNRFTFISDNSAPEIILISPVQGSVLPSNTMINITVIDSNEIGQVLFNWDETENVTLESPYDVFLITGNRLHSLRVYTIDEAGNWASATYLFTTDDKETIPTTHTTSNTSPESQTANIEIFFTFSALLMISIRCLTRKKRK